LEFEGECIDGEKSNGKEYDYNGKLVFKDEYLNEKKKK